MYDRKKVKKVFPFRDNQEIYVHLDSFEWNSSEYFGLIYLCTENAKILMDYKGFGNHGGIPVLLLVPKDPKYSSVEDVMRILEEDISELYLERIAE